MVHTATVLYLPRLCAIACARVAYVHVVHMLVVFLARRQLVNRVNWANTHQRWLKQQWNSVLFSDELRFANYRGDGRVREYRRKNELYADCCVLERNRFGVGGSVLVWAGMAHGFRTNLVVIEGNLNAQRYQDEIPARHVIPLFQNNASITLFEHGNATSHTARSIVNS